MFIGERALSKWCKIIDACGDVFMAAFRDDCLAYIEAQNEKYQRQLEDESFLDLFLGGIYHLQTRPTQCGLPARQLSVAETTPEWRVRGRVDGTADDSGNYHSRGRSNQTDP